jgi:hypothetical protein
MQASTDRRAIESQLIERGCCMVTASRSRLVGLGDVGIARRLILGIDLFYGVSGSVALRLGPIPKVSVFLDGYDKLSPYAR